MKRVGTLDVYEDWEFQKKEWRFERAGWLFLLLMLVGAMLGFSGSGPLSTKVVHTDDGGIQVTYGPYLRWQTSEFLEIEFTRAEQAREVAISDTLLKSWNIQKITPEPKEVIAGENQTLFRFEGTGPGRVRFEYQAGQVGTLEGRLLFGGGQSVVLKQFALP